VSSPHRPLRNCSNPGLNTIYNTKYNEFTPEWPQIFDSVKSTRAFEEELGITGFGLPQVKPRVWDLLRRNESGLAGALHARCVCPRLHRHQKRYSGTTCIRRSACVTPPLWHSPCAKGRKLWPPMFSTVPLMPATLARMGYSVLHFSSYKTGITWANRPSTDADISEAALEQALIDIAAFVNERGLKIRILANKLIVPPALEFDTVRILKNTEWRRVLLTGTSTPLLPPGHQGWVHCKPLPY